MLSTLANVVFAAEATAAETTKKPPNPVLPKLYEVFWAAVFFAVLYLLMRYVLMPAIQRLIDEREQKVRADLAAAEHAKDQAALVRAEYDASLAGARAEANSLLEQARAEASLTGPASGWQPRRRGNA